MTRREALARGAAAAGGVTMLSPLVAACGIGSSSQGSQGSGTGSLAEPMANLAKSRAVPEFVAPGPPFNARAAAGKKVLYLSIIFDIEIVHTLFSGVTAAADSVGVHVDSFDGKGRTDLYVQGLEMAIARKYDCILFESIVNTLVDPQLKAVKDAGIPLVYLNELFQPGPGRTVPDALVAFDYVGGSTLAADWALVDAKGGDINAAIFRADSQRHITQEMAIRQRLQKYATGKLKIQTRVVPFSELSSGWGTVTQNVMTSEPKTNYIFPVIDGICVYVVPALHQANAADRVKIATFNGTASVLELIKAKDVVGADTGGAQAWEGWLDMDRALRLMTGNKIDPPPLNPDGSINEAKSPNRLFDATNISQFDLKGPEAAFYHTENAVNGFKKLWGVA
jgi:ribose transport system substrate-binding protein